MPFTGRVRASEHLNNPKLPAQVHERALCHCLVCRSTPWRAPSPLPYLLASPLRPLTPVRLHHNLMDAWLPSARIPKNISFVTLPLPTASQTVTALAAPLYAYSFLHIQHSPSSPTEQLHGRPGIAPAGTPLPHTPPPGGGAQPGVGGERRQPVGCGAVGRQRGKGQGAAQESHGAVARTVVRRGGAWVCMGMGKGKVVERLGCGLLFVDWL